MNRRQWSCRTGTRVTGMPSDSHSAMTAGLSSTACSTVQVEGLDIGLGLRAEMSLGKGTAVIGRPRCR